MITKTADDLTGIKYTIEGGEEKGFEEVGAPNGTTIIMRNLFFNTPARKKFLKTPQTEGSYIGDVMEHMALDNPTISFHYINNRDDKFSTSGNGDLKELIYRINGRDVSVSVRPIDVTKDGITIEGYLGEPSINRSNRNFEIFFVNGRYVKDKIIYENKSLSADGTYDVAKNESEDRHGQTRAIEKLQDLIVANALAKW